MNTPIQTKLLPLALMVSGALHSNVSLAEAEEAVEKLTVTATRAARDINEIAANITVIESDRVDALGAHNIRDLLRYEPGIAVEGSGRYGISDINIRGINGDRVLMLLDGVPVADEFSFGPNLSSRRDFIDVDLIKSVEVIRGPASTLYGSDAIGGVVSFTSKDPVDLLDADQNIGGRVKLGYVSQSDETYATGQLAGVVGDFQWLVNATYRDKAETENFFDTQDPQDGSVSNGLVKLIWTPSVEQRLTFIAGTFSSDADTQIDSDIGTAVFGFVNTASSGKDERSSDRLSLHYQYQPEDSLLSRFAVDAYTQSTETIQNTALTRVSLADAATGFDRTRDSIFEQDTTGVVTQADFQFTGLGEHYLVTGFEWQKTDSEALREGESTYFDGTPYFEFSVFPARDFPISTLTEVAFYIQDEIQFFDNALTISPGVRYDTFKLDVTSDEIFENANPGVEISDYDDSEVSAKLGAVYDLTPDASIWLQWAQGFRIPPMDDVNIGFTNFLGGYTSLANPDLLPESVDSIEAGWRQSVGNFSVSVSAYLNEYENFIESLAFMGFNPLTGLLEFQATNIDDVEIKGVDLSAVWSKDNWQVNLATSWQESEDMSTGEELESVLPSRTVLGVQYGRLDDPWRVELVGTYIDEANALDDGTGTGTDFFQAPSVTLVDLLAHYQLTEDLRVNVGLYNLTDEKYWLASEVRGQSAEFTPDGLTSPGRNFSANLVYSF